MNPWSTAFPGWEQALAAGRPLVPDLPLFKAQADRAERIFNRLRIPDVIGQPKMEDAAGDWVRAIVRALFGSYDIETNRRMIQEVFLLVPKKNSKSSSAASIMVTALLMNRRPEAEFLLIAPTKEIADIAFRQAAGIIRLDKTLTQIFHPQQHIRTITHRKSGASLKVKAADTDVITGSKSTGILVDETHVFATKSKAADVFVEIRGALAARPDGFLLQISTQSKEPPSGVFRAELRNARDVRDGILDLPLLPVLYELPEKLAKDNGWKDRATWSMVNPNLGRSVDLNYLEREVTKAEREGAHQLALIASQHFNVEIGLGLRTDRWAGAEFWKRRGRPEITLEWILERSDVVVVGIDGGGLDDLFGLAVLGRDRDSQRWMLWQHGWAHEGVLARHKQVASTLRDFEAAGELTIVNDELTDLSDIVEIVRQVKDSGLLGGVGVDPAGLGELVEELKAIGITAENGSLRGVNQGFGLMNAIKTAERKLANGTLVHSGSGLAAWCVSNLKIEPTATAIRATRQGVGEKKIDVAMAGFDAVVLMAEDPQPLTIRSVYEDRGLLLV
ncbi:terminase large subunit [Methylobacterium organophilum]|uniref:terminase large subunit n=1 Tax=Methylobacterium TaxID=407 RepID=UPI0019D12F8E|nr:terminase large subunit [Methylobacterium organophilum]MBN6819532.1 terminase large subunit [Methylobacterium organophilum]